MERSVRIYFRLITQQLKAILEYQADFYITMLAALFSQILGFIFIWVIYQNIPEINGWEFWEVVFIYAMIYITEGVGSAFFDGIWRIGMFNNQGEFDRMLIRPVSPLVQVFGAAVGMNGYGNLITGLILVIQSFIHININWTFSKILMTAVFFISTVLIRLSINTISNSISLFLKDAASTNGFSYMIHNISEFAKYPIVIYPYFIQLIISIAVPYAFISYFPASNLFEKEGYILGFLTPVVAVVLFLAARKIFYKGLERYESAGN